MHIHIYTYIKLAAKLPAEGGGGGVGGLGTTGGEGERGGGADGGGGGGGGGGAGGSLAEARTAIDQFQKPTCPPQSVIPPPKRPYEPLRDEILDRQIAYAAYGQYILHTPHAHNVCTCRKPSEPTQRLNP